MTSVTCPKCNLISFGTVTSCRRCGYFWQTLSEKASQTAQAPPEPKSSGERQTSNAQNENPQNFQTPEYAQGNQPAWSQPSPPNNQNYYQPSYGQQPPLKSGLAIASMVIGIVGFVFSCLGGMLLSPIGLILGIVALVKANKHASEYGGKGFAVAGTVLNGLALICLPIILAIAIPNLLAARRAANEAAAIETVRKISAAEEIYRANLGRGRCGDLQQLKAAKLVDSTIAGGQKSGYRFVVINLPLSGGGCEITATPLTASTGTRTFFYSTEDGTIRTTNKNGQPVGQSSAPLGQETAAPETNNDSALFGGEASKAVNPLIK